MAASSSLRRLRSIRQVEEEQLQAAMELAVAEMLRLKTALKETRERVMQARLLVVSGVQTGEFLDRIAGLEEVRAADRWAEVLKRRIDSAKNRVQKTRQEFLDKRIERRQAETVCEAMQARDTAEASRKSQLALDDWYRSQRNWTSEKRTQIHSESDIFLTE